MASGTALASSPDAWDALFRKAGEACRKASDLKEAKVAGNPIDFQDSVLVIVDGRWPQPHMKNAKARFACLYGKRTGKAEAQEMPARP
jgi:hypothetical protein